MKKAKLKVDSSRTYSSSVEEGKIISQSIASGKTVDKNTTVKVVISLGKEPEPEPVYRPVVRAGNHPAVKRNLLAAGTASITGIS